MSELVTRLPKGIRSRQIAGINGLDMHVLEAGHETPGRPLLLLLHGFPELAFSWRRIMVPLAHAGYRVVAPDQRGYGRTTGWRADYDADLADFGLFNIVRDALALVFALGYRQVEAVIGHDFGSPVAAWCALLRPDVFKSVVLMSAPFSSPPEIPFGVTARTAVVDIHQALAALNPPRKHYHWYYSTRDANDNMVHAPQGLHAFLRAYYHHKSADWLLNQPYRLNGWNADELAKLPTYYVMPLHLGMAQTVATEMPTPAQIAACAWLPEADLAVYAAEYARTGFQGGLQWYRYRTQGRFEAELSIFSGRSIDVPSAFISGKQDWGVFQSPGAFEKMQAVSCSRMLDCHLIDGAGHWVQQEQPSKVVDRLLRFLAALK